MSDNVNPVDDLFAELETAQEVAPGKEETKEKESDKSKEPSKKKAPKDSDENKGKGKAKAASKPETAPEVKEAAPVPVVKEKKPAIDPALVVHIDLTNTDDRKGIMQLMAEGKYLSDADNGRQFILSFNTKHPYNLSNAPAHKIYVDEIYHISKYTYLKDMHTFEAGSRELVRNVYWVYHKGWSTNDMIDEVTFNMLRDNGLVKDIVYTFVDVLAGRSYWAGSHDKEPTIAAVIKMDTEEDKINDEMTGKSRSKVDLPPALTKPMASIEAEVESLPPVEETNTLPDLFKEVEQEGENKDGV